MAALHPPNGPDLGNTVVTVTGGVFRNYTDGLRCRFGDQVVPAQWHGPDMVACVSPRLRQVQEIQSVTTSAQETEEEEQVVTVSAQEMTPEM